MLSKSREVSEVVISKGPLSGVTFYCFKRKFFSSNQSFFNKHLTLMHMIGLKTYLKMQRKVALTTPNLLISTFHAARSEAGESSIKSLKDARSEHEQPVEEESSSDKDSKMSGISGVEENQYLESYCPSVCPSVTK